jgi:hypothetical protein
MKKNKYLLIVMLFTGLLQSCLKDSAFLNVGSTTPIVEFSYGNPTNSIVTSSLGTLPDSAEFDTVIAVNLASPQVLNTDVTVTVILDTTLVTQFNLANPTNMLTLLPDSATVGGLAKTITFTIPAGYRIHKIPLKLNVLNIDPTVSFAIPYTISSVKAADGSNIIISGNAGSILYAFIGDPIAGNYTQEWIRYNNAAGTGTPAYDQFSSTAFTPISPTEIQVTSGSAGLVYDLTFINPGTGLSGLTGWNLTFTSASVAASGVTIVQGPTIVTADPVNGIFVFNFEYLNSAGSARNITDKFTK